MTSDMQQPPRGPEPQQRDRDLAAPAADIGEDINVTTIAAVGLVATIVVIAVIMLLVGLYYKSERGELAEKYNARQLVTHTELQLQQAERLGSYGWADVEAGTVSIPIEQAMLLVAAELAREQAVQALAEAGAADGEDAGANGGEQ